MARKVKSIVASIRVLLDEIDGESCPSMKGYEFESVFVEMAQARGLHAVAVRSKGPVDVMVGEVRVQVKRRFRNPAAGLYCIEAAGNRPYSPSDFDVLALFMAEEERLAIVPSKAIVRNEFALRTYLSPGELKPWIDRWDVFGGPADDFVFYKQTEMFKDDRR